MMTETYSRWRRVVVATCILVISGCSLSDTGPTTHLPPDQFFAVLALEHHAINLSMIPPYDTVTLHTTSAMSDGRVVPGDVTYSVDNPNIRVTNGVLQAVGPVARTVVRVALTYGTVTRTDSAVVSVIASAPDQLRDFGLRLPDGDSAKSSERKTIPLIRESKSGANLSALLVSLVSADSSIAKLTQSGNNVTVTGLRPGRVLLSSSTFAFGVAWRDSLIFTVGWPLKFIEPTLERFAAGSITGIIDFAYKDFTIGVGGCVIWENASEVSDLDIHFEDSSAAVAALGTVCAQSVSAPDTGGNIAPFRKIPYDGNPANALSSYLSGWRARTFPSPGRFAFRSTLHGTAGSIYVCDERNDTTCAPARMGGWN